jgi:hypothetical protein
LPDRPGRAGPELVAAPVVELVDRLHQADIAFLDQVGELQATIGVLLRDRDYQAQIRLHHFPLALECLALAFLHVACDFSKLADLEPRLASEPLDLGPNAVYAVDVLGDDGGDRRSG